MNEKVLKDETMKGRKKKSAINERIYFWLAPYVPIYACSFICIVYDNKGKKLIHVIAWVLFL